MKADRVRATIEQAENLLTGDPWGAVSRSYYAMFYAIHLYLDENHDGTGSTIRTHKGMGLTFYRLAVEKDGLPVCLASTFENVREERENVDYDDSVEPENARQIVETAKDFVDRLLDILEK